MSRTTRLVALLSVGAMTPVTAQQIDRSRPPRLPPAPAFRLPLVHSVRLPNGLGLVVVEQHEVPVVDLALVVRAGVVRDPRDLPGLATFTAEMLDEGAGVRTALEIAEEVAFLGARYTTTTTFEYAQIGLHLPRRRLPAALDLLADVVQRPTFPEAEIARQRELRRAALLQLRDQPTQQSPLVFNAILYGADHPYGWPPQGTEASATALTRTRVEEFYRAYYRPNNARLLIVGDITPDEARRLIGERFGDWGRADVPPLPVATPPRHGARAIYLVDKPGAAQSVFRIGNVGVARNTPDYYALQVMNTILGGSFTSRLNQNLRETRGYTYGAGSSFAMRRLAGPFQATASVVTTKTDSALIEFMRELRRIRDETVPGNELQKARQYLTLGFPAEFETTAGTAQQFLDLLVNDLPLDWYGTYLARINSVDAADVQRVARRYVDVDRLAITVVGDRGRIESGLRAVGEGPIVLRDLWGQPLR